MATSNYPAVVGELPYGAVVTVSGRVSGSSEESHLPVRTPFSDRERLTLDNALTDAIRRTGVRFNVYIGDADADTVFPGTPDAAQSVLIAVAPAARTIAIRSGADVADRANDRVLQLGVTAATPAFKHGDLLDGLVSAVRVMSAAIG